MIERYGSVADKPLQQWIEHSDTYDFEELSDYAADGAARLKTATGSSTGNK